MKTNKIWQNPNFYFSIALCIILLLFYSSSQTYEQQSQVGFLTKSLHSEPFKESLSKLSFSYAGSEISIEAKGYFSFIEFFIRKGAHFITFFILGASLMLSLFYRKNPLWLSAFFGWLATTGYAGMDEFHQMLTGGRTPLFQDVMLDSSGALTAVILTMLLFKLKKWRF